MSDESSGGKPPVSIKIELAKETDKAVGEILRALLLPTASSLGGLVGDTIGIASDVVRKKRERNLKEGFSELREKLEQAGIDLDKISSVKEEELHLLLNGISLAGDKTVRDLWTGLFAQTLNPDSDISAERPFIATINSLSPIDVKILDFLATAECVSDKIRVLSTSVNNQSATREAIKAFESERELLVESVVAKGRQFGLVDLSNSSWVDNLERLGLIKVPISFANPPTPAFGRSVDFQSAVERQIEALGIGMDSMRHSLNASQDKPTQLFQRTAIGEIVLSVSLTHFGKSFLQACGLYDSN
ncbi:Abi-alpha family protein [Roseibium album]|uniref:Abi-alpha family protein n=1 Tax=Roseibium album TaxID=311410 RepID=UPI0032979541